MKKFMFLILISALVFFTGCGSDESEEDITTESSTESTTEYDEEEDFTYEEIPLEEDTQARDEAEETTQKKAEENNNTDSNNAQQVKFEDSKAYKDIETLAKNSGFDISYSDGVVVITAYIDDDSALRINSNDNEFRSEWNDKCGLYDEFCSEVVRTLKNDSASDTSMRLDVMCKSDNTLYYRNENGHGTYDAYGVG